MADYKAVFAKPRRIASAISSYFVRSSNGTDRATSGTYSVVASGTPAFDRKDGLILEASRTNLLLRSSEFDHSAWQGGSTAFTVTTDAVTDPFGTSVADRIVETATTAGKNVFQSAISITSGTTYTGSVYVKKGVGSTAPDIIQMSFGSTAFGTSQWANFNITTIAVSQSTGCTATITDVGNGWRRLTITAAATATTTSGLNAVVFCNNSPTAARIPSYAGATTSDIYAFGAQLEAGAFASTYIPTTTATVTRAASYLGPIPVGDMGIASQNNNYTVAVAYKMPFPSSVGPNFGRLFHLSAGTANEDDGLQATWSSNAGQINITKSVANTDYLVSATSRVFAYGDIVFLRVSVGASGTVCVISTPTQSNSVHTQANTSNFAANIDYLTVGSLNVGAASSQQVGATCLGFRIWDTALSQAQLEALTTADLDGTTYLTSWSTELGSDPPASVTISDENITTGSLDWWRFGESADTSENTKNASYASYLGGSANINTPAFGRYTGATDKGFPLVVYTDGTSPSSGSNRYFTSTGVAGAGRRNVVTSQGKPLWIHILAGGYDGVHQHVATTSDSSSPVHTRTNTTGATTIKTWETIIYWGGAASSTLTIDSTAVSGSIGLQLAAITVFPVDPTITTLGATAIDPGTDLTINHINFQSAPTSVTYASQTEALTSASTTQSVMTGIPIGDFAPAQAHVATRMKANYTLTLSDGYESASYTVQVDPMPTATAYEDWSTKDATNWYGPTVPGTWQTGDEIYGYYLTGYGQVEAGTGWFSPDPLGLPAQGRLICYDISAGQWLAGVNTEIYTGSSTGVVEGIVMAVVRPIVKSVVEAIS